jgi:hypothetical protein
MENAESWGEAASGLETHKSAVVFRIVVVIAAVLYVVMQMMAKHGSGDPGAFTLVLGAAELLTTLIGIAGISRFAGRAPSGSGSAAGFATICLIGVAAAEVWTIWIVFRVIQATANPSGTHDLWDLIKQAERLPYIQLAAGIAGMIAILAVLGGISGVARTLGDEALGRRARGMMIATVILGIAYGLVQRWIASGRVNDSAIAVLAMLAVYGLVVLFGYIGVLTSAIEAMRRGGAAPLPIAEIRND